MSESPAIEATVESGTHDPDHFRSNAVRWYHAKREVKALKNKIAALNEQIREIEEENAKFMKSNRVPSVQLGNEDWMEYKAYEKKKAPERKTVITRLARELNTSEERAAELYTRITAKSKSTVEKINWRHMSADEQAARDYASAVLDTPAAKRPKLLPAANTPSSSSSSSSSSTTANQNDADIF